MTDPIQNTLQHTAEDVLEKLAFMFSFPEDQEEPMNYESAVAASVSFSGPFNGKLIMTVSKEILPELAGNMLGIEDNTTTEQQYDALRELINVVCGNLLPAIAGKESVFNVNAPLIITDSNFVINENKDSKPVSVAKMTIEDEPCEIFLFAEGEIPVSSEQAES